MGRPVIRRLGRAQPYPTSFPFLIVKKGHNLPDLEKLRDDPKAWLEQIGENADLYRLRRLLTKQRGNWFVDRAVLERFSGLGFDE